MELTTLKTALKETIKDNELNLFFEKTEQHIVEYSELKDIILLLHSRHRKYKIKLIKGTFSHEDQTVEHNQILDRLLEVVELIEEDDLKKEKVVPSVTTLLLEIDFRKKEFQNIINDKSSKIIRIGNDLIGLGNVLQEKPSPDDKIPYEQKITIGTQKGIRRIKIGFLELQELKSSMLEGIQKIHITYSDLVKYLDAPNEEIGTEQFAGIQSAAASLEIFMKKYNPEDEPEIAQITKARSMFDQLFKYKDQLGETFDNYFIAIEDVLPKFDDTLTFLVANQKALQTTKTKLQKTLTELQFNIKENEI